jgi:hypothetical protein
MSYRLTFFKASLSATLWSFVFATTALPAQQDKGESPSGAIGYTLSGSKDEKQLFLFSPDKPKQKVLLCETPGFGNMVVSFSPNEEWIVVQDGGGSLGVSLRLFHKERDLKFTEEKDANIDGKVEMAALQQNGFPATEILEHRYVRLLQWSGDSSALLVAVSGRGASEGRHVRIDGWVAAYQIRSGTIIFDLKAINAHAFIHEVKIEG